MTDHDMPKLKDCPFCGKGASLKIRKTAIIECNGVCGALVIRGTKETAIKAWNTRADAAVPQGVVEAIEIADSGLKWADHKDFKRVYTALEKVFHKLSILTAQGGEK